MPVHSELLAALNAEDRKALESRLLTRQTGKCFICDETIDLFLSEGQLDIDHIDPVITQGLDDENNFALTHAACNRSKGSSDLRVARRMAEFEKLQQTARNEGDRGANLGHVLARYGGSVYPLRLKRNADRMEFLLSPVKGDKIQSVPLYKDPLSGMEYFFAVFPLEFMHHDDRINPRSIGPNIRGLIEEFMQKRPQLQVSLAWWEPDADGAGKLKVFDGQHKAAAQILLGGRELPLRVFVQPDINVLLQTNTNAGDKLRQVAFDAAVLRHLGSTLYAERVHQYQEMKGLNPTDYSFTEKDLVGFFKGEHREMLRYIMDSARDSITHNKDNRLMEFVEWSGKSADRPLSYSAISRTFFSQFLYLRALDTPVDDRMEQGENPRQLEREQLVRLMCMFANVFFVNQWDPDKGGRKLEYRLQKGDAIPEGHLRAWRVSREEILANLLAWVRLVIENYYAWTGKMMEKERIFHQRVPEDCWQRVETALKNISGLPCWVDKNLSLTVFGGKQPLDFWATVFKTAKAPTGVQVLAKPLELQSLIQSSNSQGGH